MKRKILGLTAAVVCCILIVFLLQALLVPKYMSDIPEGALIAEYYEEESTHDVIFIGDCEVYENFSPLTLWEEQGVTSYIRGSPQQLIWQSYYLLEDTLKYETPEVVVFNVLSMKYDEPQSESYNRLTLDGMKLSLTKLRAASASMTEEEDLITYIFPILRYHSRWSELSSDDFRFMFSRDKVSHNGFMMRADVNPAGDFPEPAPLGNYSFSQVCWDYLDRMTALCSENGIELILIKAPTLYPHWYEQWDQQIEEYARQNDIRYINMIDIAEEAGIDMKNDTYDKGLHLNLAGAEKLTSWFGRYLAEECGLESHADDEELARLWEEKAQFYYDMKADQEYELETYGCLMSY